MTLPPIGLPLREERPSEAMSPAKRDGVWRRIVNVFRYVPTRRLAVILVALAPLWIVVPGPALLYIELLLLAALLVLDAWTIPGAAIRLVRRVPETVGIGDEVPGTYELESLWMQPVTLALHDELPRGVARGATVSGMHAVPKFGGLSLPFSIVGRERGAWPLGTVVLRVRGRLGLIERSLRFSMDDAVSVVPSIAGIRRYRLLSIEHRLHDTGVRAIRRRGEGTAFAGLREYVVGDDPRRIDWKATARRRKLITREFNIEQGQTVLIAIDAGRMMTQLDEGLPRFEYALSSALVLTDIAVQSGDQVGLIIFDDEIRAFVPATKGAAALTRIRAALIPARPTMSEPDYAAAFRLLAERHRKRSLIVLFTDVIDPRASHSLIAHTARSAARHLPLVVALRNDRLLAAAIPREHPSSTRLYESAAAEELVTARDEALLRMRRAGVSTLDVPPRAMTAALINRYLEIKARAAL
ncbi:MAG: DUF58 domain-containing protein [Gemmatimonadota bacterium]|nr:DUF58 domain-containing protein [Gemmatimonadota bacterium]